MLKLRRARSTATLESVADVRRWSSSRATAAGARGRGARGDSRKQARQARRRCSSSSADRVTLGSPQAGRRLLSAPRPRWSTLKGLILSGGKGTRLRPITHTSAKQLVPVANKPVLFYGIEAMAAAGIRAGRDHHRAGDRRRDPRGGRRRLALRRRDHLHRAGRAARARARGADRRAVPRQRPVRHVPRRQPAPGRDRGPRERRSASHAPEALILLTPVPDPENYGVAELDARAPSCGWSRSRPSPPSDLALVGVYMFTPLIHEAARAIEPSRARRARDHRRDPVAGRRRQARRVARRARLVEGHRPARRHARGQPADPRDGRAARRGRARSTRRSTAAWSSSRAPGSSARPSAGPAIIGAGALLRDAYVGPYTAVGAGCVIEDAEVEHSILLEASSVRGLDGRMESSLLGKNVRDLPRRPSAARLSLHGGRQLGDRHSVNEERARPRRGEGLSEEELAQEWRASCRRGRRCPRSGTSRCRSTRTSAADALLGQDDADDPDERRTEPAARG